MEEERTSSKKVVGPYNMIKLWIPFIRHVFKTQMRKSNTSICKKYLKFAYLYCRNKNITTKI